MTDSDECNDHAEDGWPAVDLTRPRKLAWPLVGAAVLECVGNVFGVFSESFDTLASMAVAHEKYRDDNAELGRQIEALTDVTPFQ